jgi:Flp pilus assembly protein TadD
MDKIIKEKPDSPELYASRATSEYALGDYQSAIKDYDHAISLESHTSEYWYCRSLAYQARGNTSQAALDCIRAIELGFQPPE